jgi:hypothetical protein
MRLEFVSPAEIVVTLSQRNLLALLAKLGGYPPDSTCTITCAGVDGPGLTVHAESDEEHYGDRPEPPGAMHPNTEARIQSGTPSWRWRGAPQR